MSEATALVFEEREYTLAELDDLAAAMAGLLERRGVTAGQRVALMSSNRPEFVVALRAIWGLGAAAVLLSPAWRRTEVEHALALTKPAHAVGDHPVLAEFMPMLHLDVAVKQWIAAADPNLKIVRIVRDVQDVRDVRNVRRGRIARPVGQARRCNRLSRRACCCSGWQGH